MKPNLLAELPRAIFGGFLMGLANLVPGISGGTLLLASGAYPTFIGAISSLTRFKFRLREMVALGALLAAAACAILLGAGFLKELVLNHRWIMYSLFIGMTLGGIPVIWRQVGRPTATIWGGAVAGCAAMVGVALLQAQQPTGTESASSFMILLLAGLAGGSAMILPGISGGYLLLVMGQYIPILDGISRFKTALFAMDWATIWQIGLTLVLPVGLGIAIGVVAVSNLLQMLLKNFKRATLGVLLGLLVGAVAGLWPFQEGVPPTVGQVIKGRVMTEQAIAELDPADYPVTRSCPTPGKGLGALLLIGVGYAITIGVAGLGRHGEEPVT